jgi:formylglycine-generating enzyme required for sulfatase activity
VEAEPAIVPFSANEAFSYQRDWAQKLGVPIEYANSQKMHFRLIPPGRFTMGSPPEDVTEGLPFVERIRRGGELLASELPQHEVTLGGAWLMGTHEVTQDQFEAVSGENPSFFTHERRAMAKSADPVGAPDPNEAARRPRLPVDSVSWKRATEFCNELSQLEGLPPTYSWMDEQCTVTSGPGYRLPTEAEWEFACRAGADNRYGVVGNFDVHKLPNYIVYARTSAGRPHAVGQKPPNAFGLFDMLGNQAEWCQDGWDPGYYSQFAQAGAIDPQGPAGDFELRVLRGGDWRSGPVGIRCATRGANDPKAAIPTVGLRVVLPLAGLKILLAADRDKAADPPEQPPGPIPRGGLP